MYMPLLVCGKELRWDDFSLFGCFVVERSGVVPFFVFGRGAVRCDAVVFLFVERRVRGGGRVERLSYLAGDMINE